MIHTFLPMYNWDYGIYGAIFMFVVFAGLVVALLVFMFGGKKKNNEE
ncbi:MAG: hypothetical protein J7K34_00400 [Flavobacteriaceae bacterium]|nr:hypothetical protein [Flavobacteriaceae bacterium]